MCDCLEKIKIFLMNRWNTLDKVNKVFIVLSGICTLKFIGLFVVICFPCMESNLYALHVGLCGIFASFASALDIAVVVRMVDLNRYIKQCENAKKTLMPIFLTIYTTIDSFFQKF